MSKKKKCCFCRVSLERHAAIAWDGFSSACVTKKNKVTEDERKKYFEKLKPMWNAWGRAFGGDATHRPMFNGNGLVEVLDEPGHEEN